MHTLNLLECTSWHHLCASAEICKSTVCLHLILTPTKFYDINITSKIDLILRPHTENTQMQCTPLMFPNATLTVALRCFGGNRVSPPWGFAPKQLPKVTKTLNWLSKLEWLKYLSQASLGLKGKLTQNCLPWFPNCPVFTNLILTYLDQLFILIDF